jgi:uncharacterized membrane protein YeiB
LEKAHGPGSHHIIFGALMVDYALMAAVMMVFARLSDRGLPRLHTLVVVHAVAVVTAVPIFLGFELGNLAVSLVLQVNFWAVGLGFTGRTQAHLTQR